MFLLSNVKINTKVTKFIMNLSYASYCIYLTHRIIFKVAVDIYKPEMDIITLLYLYFVAIPIIYIVSIYTQMFYDKSLKYGTLLSQRYSIS